MGSFPAARPIFGDSPEPGGESIASVSYDTNGNVTRVEQADGQVFEYTYNSDGTPHTQTRDGVTRTYAYDNGLLVSVS
jgi:YD repeat-containing protein